MRLIKLPPEPTPAFFAEKLAKSSLGRTWDAHSGYRTAPGSFIANRSNHRVGASNCMESYWGPAILNIMFPGDGRALRVRWMAGMNKPSLDALVWNVVHQRWERAEVKVFLGGRNKEGSPLRQGFEEYKNKIIMKIGEGAEQEDMDMGPDKPPLSVGRTEWLLIISGSANPPADMTRISADIPKRAILVNLSEAQFYDDCERIDGFETGNDIGYHPAELKNSVPSGHRSAQYIDIDPTGPPGYITAKVSGVMF